MNLQLGRKMKKYFFRLQCYERGTKKKNRTHRLSYNINSHTAFVTADPNSLRDVSHASLVGADSAYSLCGPVIERLSVA